MRQKLVTYAALQHCRSPVGSQAAKLPQFSTGRESEPNWDAEIAEDVRGECSKYGPVDHVWVDRNSGGFVYVVSGTSWAIWTPPSGKASLAQSVPGRQCKGQPANGPACLPVSCSHCHLAPLSLAQLARPPTCASRRSLARCSRPRRHRKRCMAAGLRRAKSLPTSRWVAESNCVS